MKTAILVSLVATSLSAHAAGNLLVDGDFTSNQFSGPRIDGTGYSAFLAGASFGAWTVLSGNVDRITDLWNAPVSGNSIDLNGNVLGSIGQMLNLPTGAYELGFYVSGNPAGLPLEKLVRVQAGNVSQIFSYALPNGIQSGPYSLSYEFKTLPFQANGSTQLIFSSINPTTTQWGAVIGNITVTAVPELPISVMFTFGLMSIFLARSRSIRTRHGVA